VRFTGETLSKPGRGDGRTDNAAQGLAFGPPSGYGHDDVIARTGQYQERGRYNELMQDPIDTIV